MYFMPVRGAGGMHIYESIACKAGQSLSRYGVSLIYPYRPQLKLVFTVLAAVFFCAQAVFAQSAGNNSVEFLKISADPDSIALGESILSLDNSPAGIIANPAVLAGNYQPKISFTNTVFGDDIRYNFGGIAIPVKLGTIGLAASSIDYGNIQAYDASGNKYISPVTGETAVIFNYALPIREEIPVMKEYGSLGMNIKFLHSNLAGYSSDVTAFDFGGTCNLPFVLDGLSGGLVFRNNGGASNYLTVSGKLPASMNAALRYDYKQWKEFFAVADTSIDPDNSYYSAGIGFSPVYPLSLRCAWRQADNSAASGFRFGFGLVFSDFSLRYSMSPLQDISTVNTIALDVRFGSFTQPKAAYVHYLDYYYQLGRDKYNSEDYIEARQVFESILSVYPGHLPSKEYLLKINSKLDELEQRQQVQVDRWLRKAGVALERDDVFAAKKYYGLVLNIDSENAEAKEGMNKISEQLNNYSVNGGQGADNSKIDKLWNDALGAYKKGDYVSAREYFQQILRIDPDDEKAAEYLKNIYEQTAKITAAQLQELFNKGIDLYRQGEYENAERYFSSVALSNPDRKDVREYLDSCRQKIAEKNKNTAKVEASNKTAMIQGDIESLYFSALKMFQSGEYDNAIAAFTKCRELSLQNGYNKYAESSKYYIGASKSAFAEHFYKSGYDYYKNDKLEAAVACYSKALEYNPEYSAAKVELERLNNILAQGYYEKGAQALSAGANEKAKELFRKSLEYKIDKSESIKALERLEEKTGN